MAQKRQADYLFVHADLPVYVLNFADERVYRYVRRTRQRARAVCHVHHKRFLRAGDNADLRGADDRFPRHLGECDVRADKNRQGEVVPLAGRLCDNGCGDNACNSVRFRYNRDSAAGVCRKHLEQLGKVRQRADYGDKLFQEHQSAELS